MLSNLIKRFLKKNKKNVQAEKLTHFYLFKLSQKQDRRVN